jgi:hypothetical protein
MTYLPEKPGADPLRSGPVQYEPVPYGYGGEEAGHEFDYAVKADEVSI